MKNTFKKVVAALMACVAVATVTSGCKNNVDSHDAEAVFGMHVIAEAEARNELEVVEDNGSAMFYEELRRATDRLEETLAELEVTRTELEKTRTELEKTRAELDAARAELANYQKKLE